MKPAPLVALGLALNRGKSPYFVLISGRYTSRGRPDHLTTSEHSDRGCGEADSNVLRSMRTLRFVLVARAGRLARIGGRQVLRLTFNPATAALYTRLGQHLAA